MPYRGSAGSDLVYVTFNGVVSALDSQGQVRWKHSGSSAMTNPSVYVCGELLLVFLGGTLSALDALHGTLRWRVGLPVDLPSRAKKIEAHGELVLVQVDSALYAVALGDGTLRWQARSTEFVR